MTKNASRIQTEIEEHERAKIKLKRLVPFGVITVFAFGFVFPLLPRRRGRITDFIDYPLAVVICIILSGSIYLFGYYTAIKKRKQQIKKLKEQLEETKN